MEETLDCESTSYLHPEVVDARPRCEAEYQALTKCAPPQVVRAKPGE
jgi:hypothetical protein